MCAHNVTLKEEFISTSGNVAGFNIPLLNRTTVKAAHFNNIYVYGNICSNITSHALQTYHVLSISHPQHYQPESPANKFMRCEQHHFEGRKILYDNRPSESCNFIAVM